MSQVPRVPDLAGLAPGLSCFSSPPCAPVNVIGRRAIEGEMVPERLNLVLPPRSGATSTVARFGGLGEDFTAFRVERSLNVCL